MAVATSRNSAEGPHDINRIADVLLRSWESEDAELLARTAMSACGSVGWADPLQPRLLSAVLVHVFGFETDLDTLEPITVAEVAAAVPDHRRRRQLIDLMVSLEVICNPIPQELSDSVDAWAAGLGVDDDDALLVAREFAAGEVARATADFVRSTYSDIDDAQRTELDPASTMEFLNDGERWATTRTPAFDEPVMLEDGSFYFREHILSMFRSNLPLEDYPYDKPDLKIVIEDVALGVDSLVFVLDDPTVATSPDLSVPGYKVGRPTATVTEWTYSPMGAMSPSQSASSRIVLTIPMSRPWLPYTVKIFVPFLIIILCASIVLLLHPKHVDARFGMGISALLTLVALKWITDGEMPNVDYMGLVDSLYLMAFLFIAVGLIQTTYSTWRNGEGDDPARLARLGVVTLVITGTLFVVGCVGILLAFLL